MGFARIFHSVIDINNAMAHMLEAICLNTKCLNPCTQSEEKSVVFFRSLFRKLQK